MRGARCDRSGRKSGEGSAAPGPKSPRWSAERRASRVMGRKAPRKRLTCRVTACPTGASHAPERLSALRPPLDWGERSKDANPGRKSAPRERDGLFEIVSWTERDAVLILRSAHAEENPQSTNGRARVSKDEDEPMCAPSCFETHRSALRLWEQLHSHSAAMLLSMRARGEAPTCGCGK